MIVGIEIDRGLVVDSLVGAGHRVDGVDPLAISRCRERHSTSGAKSDAGDATLLADLVRTAAHNHRPIAGDSEQVSAIRVLARAQQCRVWSRQRQVSGLRSARRDDCPGALSVLGADLAGADGLAILELAPTPELGRGLSRATIAAALTELAVGATGSASGPDPAGPAQPTASGAEPGGGRPRRRERGPRPRARGVQRSDRRARGRPCRAF